ncbi:MAG: hypothetical protein PUH11_04465 [Bacilli bacterium]|nr:hypothetical protein [Bacilli bacterium]
MKNICILDVKQATFYLKHGLKAKDMFYSDRWDKIVYVYDEEDTKKVWELWKESKHKH